MADKLDELHDIRANAPVINPAIRGLRPEDMKEILTRYLQLKHLLFTFGTIEPMSNYGIILIFSTEVVREN